MQSSLQEVEQRMQEQFAASIAAQQQMQQQMQQQQQQMQQQFEQQMQMQQQQQQQFFQQQMQQQQQRQDQSGAIVSVRRSQRPGAARIPAPRPQKKRTTMAANANMKDKRYKPHVETVAEEENTAAMNTGGPRWVNPGTHTNPNASLVLHGQHQKMPAGVVPQEWLGIIECGEDDVSSCWTRISTGTCDDPLFMDLLDQYEREASMELENFYVYANNLKE